MQYRKLVMLLFVCVLALFTVHNTVSANTPFVDVPKSHGSYDEINFLVNKGVISGYTENGKKYYKPNNKVTRGQAAKMLVKATNNTGLKVNKSSFDDIQTNQEVSPYAERVLSKGWFQYTSGKNFSPNMVVSRMEMAKIISLAYGLNVTQYANLDIPFKDVEKNSMYYKYIAAAYYNGIIASNSKFNPKDGVTRSQFALFVARATSKTYRLDLPIQGVGVPDPSKALGEVEVTTDGLNVRSTADFSSTADNKVGTANKGDILKYYEVTSTYYKVAFKGEYAYIYKSYAKIVTDDKPVTSNPTPQPDKPTTTTGTIGIATVNDLAVRQKADGSSKRLGLISRGTQLPVHSVTGNWAKVTYKGNTGYVHKTYLRLKNTSGSAVKGRIIVLDPGHGGKDPGAESNGAQEKTVVFNVTKKLKAMLEAKGAIVYLTRSGDTYPELSERVQYARNKNGEMFISIHANAATAAANGTETFHSISNNANGLEDAVLARYINEEIVENADMNDRKVKQADYYVIKNLVMPAVLVELGFITNDGDRSKLISDKYQTIFAESIYNGIMRYYSR